MYSVLKIFTIFIETKTVRHKIDRQSLNNL